MEIGPVNAIRPVPAVRPSPPGRDSDLSGVFAAEFREQQRDDSYSPSRSANRGLEDEEAELDEGSDEADLDSVGSIRLIA
jgi:hypothetical protein